MIVTTQDGYSHVKLNSYMAKMYMNTPVAEIQNKDIPKRLIEACEGINSQKQK